MKTFYKEYLDVIAYLATNNAYKAENGSYRDNSVSETANISLLTALYGMMEGGEGPDGFRLPPNRRAFGNPEKRARLLSRGETSSVIEEALKQSLGPRWHDHYEALKCREQEFDEVCRKFIVLPEKKNASRLYPPARIKHTYPSDIHPAEYHAIKTEFFEKLSRHMRGEGVENKELSTKFMSRVSFTGTEEELLERSKNIFGRFIKKDENQKALDLVIKHVPFVYFRPTTPKERLGQWYKWYLTKEQVRAINSTIIEHIIEQEILRVTKGCIFLHAFEMAFASREDKESQSEQLLFAFNAHAAVIKSVMAAEPGVRKIEELLMREEEEEGEDELEDLD